MQFKYTELYSTKHNKLNTLNKASYYSVFFHRLRNAACELHLFVFNCLHSPTLSALCCHCFVLNPVIFSTSSLTSTGPHVLFRPRPVKTRRNLRNCFISHHKPTYLTSWARALEKLTVNSAPEEIYLILWNLIDY